MISLENLINLLTINNGLNLNDFLAALLTTPQIALLCEKKPKLKKMLRNLLPRIREEINETLKNTPVPENLVKEFQLFFQLKSTELAIFNLNLVSILTELEKLNSPFSLEANQLMLNHPNEALTLARQALFLQRWRLSLVLQVMDLNQTVLDDQQERLIEELSRQMIFIDQLAPIFGDDEKGAGQLWDNSHATLTKGSSYLLKKYANFLTGYPQINTLAERLGRSRDEIPILQSENQKIATVTTLPLPDEAREEIKDIHHSDDIIRLLPPELSMLSLSELELEFYRKLIDKQLLTYQRLGHTHKHQTLYHPATLVNKAEQSGGPFLICIDTSGSMGQFRERCAKAFCLALLRISLRDHRRCFLMMFTTEVIHYELTAEQGIEKALRFLSQDFKGGTDLEKCLQLAAGILKQPEWQAADVLVISDFISQHLSESLRQNIKARQQLNQRFHALTMARQGKAKALAVFDYIWEFDISLMNRLLRFFKR